jgi:transcriptional regulator with XRE-family HTH domain
MSIIRRLWENIERYKEREGIKSDNELARLAGVGQPLLHKIKNGQQKSVNFSALEKLAKVFKVDPAQLFEPNLDFLKDPQISHLNMVMEKLPSQARTVVLATGEALLSQQPIIQTQKKTAVSSIE